MNRNKLRNRNKNGYPYIVQCKYEKDKEFKFIQSAKEYVKKRNFDCYIFSLDYDETFGCGTLYRFRNGKFIKLQYNHHKSYGRTHAVRHIKMKKLQKLICSEKYRNDSINEKNMNKILKIINYKGLKVTDKGKEFYNNFKKHILETNDDILEDFRKTIGYYSDRLCDERIYTIGKFWEEYLNGEFRK